ncbi:MAG: PHP domain-containing protein [Phycisphaerales bacterium]|nr:PHP domain-containing protein [Phycisphaerales bacterium]
MYQGEKLLAGTTETEVYEALGLAYIPPELREGRDELKIAEKGESPRLLEVSDIKAELHAHTRASDGKLSIRELILTALDRGFHTIAVTDHSVSQTVAHGLSAQRLEEHITQIRELAAEFKKRITVLAGSEVDILADGRLDYPSSLLKELDIVVASPHSALNQDPVKATLRLRKAIENPYVTIMGHPTGRLIGRREGLSPDWKELIKAAKARGIAMEINANSHRLDLRDTHARAMREAGVKLAINTDAHGPADFDELIYGVLTARRAGATPVDVVNTMNDAALKKWITSTRP